MYSRFGFFAQKDGAPEKASRFHEMLTPYNPNKLALIEAEMERPHTTQEFMELLQLQQKELAKRERISSSYYSHRKDSHDGDTEGHCPKMYPTM
jgi:hypothetical protein